MEAKFESEFHKWYVGGEGEVEPPKSEPRFLPAEKRSTRSLTMSEILDQYRWYVGDETAQLPKALEQHLLAIGTEDDRTY
jgi:hypothetical protein